MEDHFPHLTVGQILNFAVATRTPTAQRARKVKGQCIHENTDMLVSTFGLRHSLQTLVGNDSVGGVSGGERKRVSLAKVVRRRVHNSSRVLQLIKLSAGKQSFCLLLG